MNIIETHYEIGAKYGESHYEIGANIFTNYTLFEEHQIKRTQKLITAWDTFTANMPGESRRIETDIPRV